MQATDELERAIGRLQADYWARVDFLDPDPPEALFTQACVFELGSMTLNGRAEVGAFFRRRQETAASTGRVTRHLAANLRVRPIDGRTAAASSTVLVMSGYGALPIISEVPSVGDFEDVCVLEPDGVWRFDRRRASSIFAGPDAPAFAQAAKESR